MSKKEYLQAEGVIEKLDISPKDAPRIYVRYKLRGTEYVLKERLRMQQTVWKVGMFPVGTCRKPVLQDLRVGGTIMINVNANNYKDAYLPQNRRYIVRHQSGG